jgi:vacuolar-type H+-ATPase subunit I/STV1
LGACDKIHNDRLKEKYQKTEDKSKYPYENEFYDYLNKLINDLARKIRQGNGRLSVQLDDKAAEQRKEEREEKMVLLDVKIKEMLQKVEEAGEEGRVQEATDMQNEVDKLQEELKQFKEVSLCGWFVYNVDLYMCLAMVYIGLVLTIYIEC